MRTTDLDGDGKADLTVYRPSTGTWFTLRSSTSYTASATFQWGRTATSRCRRLRRRRHDRPRGVPAVDRDCGSSVSRARTSSRPRRFSGVSTATCRCPATTTATARPISRCIGRPPGRGSSGSRARTSPRSCHSSGASPATSRCRAITTATVRPISPCGGRPPATWFIRQSSTGYATFVSFQWGLDGDITVPGDYDGDGKTDLAVYRPSIGTWFIRLSSEGYATAVSISGALNGDTPVPGDFDGDGKTDLPSAERATARGSSCSRAPTSPRPRSTSGACPATSRFSRVGNASVIGSGVRQVVLTRSRVMLEDHVIWLNTIRMS